MDYCEDIDTIKETTRRIRERRMRMEREDVQPDRPCSKCRSTCWQRDDDIGHWYCVRCGNRGFWERGLYIDTWELTHVLGH